MSTNVLPISREYVLATGEPAVKRLHLLHNIYAPAGVRVLAQAGLRHGMNVADFGCGVGVVSRMLAEIVGPLGSVTGIDLNAAQLDQAAVLCAQNGLTNASFVHANACNTGLPRNSFDLVYCRFLLLHLPDPEACLREMHAVLKPGGIIVVEDGDLASATSVPPTALNAFADLFGHLGPIRGVNYSIANGLYQLVKDSGFADVNIEIHQPASARGDAGLLLQWSVEEAGTAFVDAGLVTSDGLARTVAEMADANDNADVLAFAPRMSLVWGRKP